MVRENENCGCPCLEQPTGSGRIRPAFIAVTTLLALMFAMPAVAQQIPSTVEADRLEDSFERPPTPRSERQLPTDKAIDNASPRDNAQEVKFVLSGLIVEGATVYDTSELLPLYEERLGQEVTLRDIYEIADHITAYYRADGYFLSRAIVPPQRISGGIVQIQVIEGYIDSISFEGGTDDHIVYLHDYADKILTARPVTMAVLERYLLLAGDLPGVDVRSIIRPARNQPGASELVMVVEQEEIETSFGVDNFGSDFVGPYRARARVTEYANLWSGSENSISYLTSVGKDGADWSELEYLELTHAEHVGSEGVKVTGKGSLVKAEPGSTLNDLDIESQSVAAEVAVSYPFIRSRNLSLSVEGALGFRNSSTDILGERLFEDKIRTARASLTADYADSFDGLTLINASVSRGLPILGHTENGSGTLSRSDARTDFTKFSGAAYRIQDLPLRLSLLTTVLGQVSNSGLVSGEEFGVGGGTIGRGYSPSEITGDHGIAGSLELRWSPAHKVPHLDSYQLFGFYDVGAVADYRTDDTDSLASAGLGVRAEMFQIVDASLLYGQPLTKKPDGRTDEVFGLNGRWLFEINATY